ncbi:MULTISPECIES: ATP-dependent protease ATPase subunit HslU [Sphaerochaeta]|jgi:ATP-dependent HslUV protease ATP-binding subunit HslU|uniref:ATP-dependent protease ATPase subunit HslU n=2 Tax=root TaxID=1 RepID=A0ABY4DGB2_9SPIR|nr:MULTISPECIES: ATP-dependent protease ATPase subunit HslU [Sphaerochaeta]MDT3358116.1 ATP-dependent protease ATPase subunit HslU [Spirochaetota bacterium]MDD2394432.1 ATP-dependent protease ATPase subunit HslU [Sphaerochaeta sp.]MDD3423098.1 ATP-dependent protease ATPase subunit HslU [Sphaerochaeta sp.]MDD3456710.1 ATP-dependent protease ATPase subunit HslU [Sphaerochaeta sp.]MDD4037563.1 ATP-dependent protease ATPase subunit HslU [Sphaerochaeta sp.]
MVYTASRKLDELKPSEIVKELDKYIIGQKQAKRTIAVAIRNRTRRKRLPLEIRDEVSPKNIIMIGPTGVGKTEIARRIAKLSNAPFIKVEATKYTEVGYVGRDVESIIRDLMSIAVQQVKAELAEREQEKVVTRVEDRLLDILLPQVKEDHSVDIIPVGSTYSDSQKATRERFRQMLRDGKFDEREVEINVQSRKRVGIEVLGQPNMEELQEAMQSIGSIFGNGKGHNRKLTVKRAREIFTEEETDKAVDTDRAIDEAKERVEQMGIVFIDEIDKVAKGGGSGGGIDVSREGVQRDILPIIEGTSVSTKWGVIDTTHILFIASGAFHVSKPSDLIPELQGRFPLRVELDDLKAEDFYRILTEPANAITMQYRELLKTEGVQIIFEDDAIRRISEIAYEVNSNHDNIGARRLFTIMEKLLEELSFSADELSGQTIPITQAYVDERLGDVIQNQDLSKFIL